MCNSSENLKELSQLHLTLFFTHLVTKSVCTGEHIMNLKYVIFNSFWFSKFFTKSTNVSLTVYFKITNSLLLWISKNHKILKIYYNILNLHFSTDTYHHSFSSTLSSSWIWRVCKLHNSHIGSYILLSCEHGTEKGLIKGRDYVENNVFIL